MAEQNINLWAPWRAEYIRSLDPTAEAQPCFLCAYAGSPDEDASHHVIRRSGACLMTMNRYPYTNGHLLIAPLQHRATLDDIDDDVLLEIGRLTRLAMRVLHAVVRAGGYNVGMNFGRCAGAGLPGHLHAHVVPRWSGDTNFMTTVGDVRLIPEDHEQLYLRLKSAAEELAAEVRDECQD